jgi:hypothetical protein
LAILQETQAHRACISVSIFYHIHAGQHGDPFAISSSRIGMTLLIFSAVSMTVIKIGGSPCTVMVFFLWYRLRRPYIAP